MRMQNAPQLTLYMAPLSTFQESFSTPQGHLTCTRVSSVNFKIQCTSALPPPPQYHGTRPTHIPGDLGHTSFVYIRYGAHRNHLQCPYAGPFPVLEWNEKYLVINYDGKIEKVTVDLPQNCSPISHGAPVPSNCIIPTTSSYSMSTAVPLRSRSGREIRPRDRLNL